MKQKLGDSREKQRVLSWIPTALVVATLLIAVFWVLQATDQTDSFLLATAIVLLVSASVGSLLNVIRNQALSGQVKANSLALALHERILDEHTIVCVTDRSGKIVEVNQNFSDTFGYSKSEILGQSTSILFRNEAGQKHYEDALKSVFEGHQWSGLEELSDKLGRRVTAQTTISPKVGPKGQIVGLVIIRTDVTTALAQSAEVSRNAFVEILRDGVVIFDPWSFDINYANDAFTKRLGWDAMHSRPRLLSDLFHKDELKMFQRYLDPLLKNEAAQVVFEVDHASGPVEVLTHAVEDVTGKRSFVSVVRDITERKKDEQLKLSSVSTVSHELRTPLTSIKGALRLLESGVMGEMNPEASRLVNVAHRNSERLLAIVNDILTLEKLHSDSLMISADDFDLRTLLKDAAEANSLFASECEVQFRVESAPEPAFVRADPQRLMQVMSNLMSNAAKFSPANAVVAMRIVDCDTVWRVCVEDTGPGIPEDARDTLFDSFIQIAGTQRTNFPSTGLGLTICREIIQRHGGRIAFDTKVGRGTTFYFELEKRVNESFNSNARDVA